MTVGERIKQKRIEIGMSVDELASKLGKNRATVYRYESNEIENLPISVLGPISEALHVSPIYLLGLEDKKEPPKPSNVDIILDMKDIAAIPLLGRVAAGVPLYDEGNIIGKIYINPEQKNSDECFGLEVVGDSMMPRMRPGDTLVVRSQSDAENGDYVVVTINGDESIVKKLQKHKDGITLISLNPAYDPMHFTNEEIETLPVLVRGRVIEIRSRV